MKSITHTAELAFSAQQIYDLVNDIDKYPEFLPWCTNAQITDQTESEIQAKLTVKEGPFEKTFETRNLLVPNKSMTLKLIDGPFKIFEGDWTFESVSEQQCKVTYTMKFEFNNLFIGLLAEPIFERIADHMIDAFKKRAEQIYS